jgi:succinate dehydrogenase / fumarate reductase iron-sulfur subunit
VGPQALAQAYRYNSDSRDQGEEERLDSLDRMDGVWGCEFAGACSEVCPKGVDPALTIQQLKLDIMKRRLTGRVNPNKRAR